MRLVLVISILYTFSALACDTALTGKYRCTNNINDNVEELALKFENNLIYFPNAQGDGKGYEFDKLYQDSWEEYEDDIYFDITYSYVAINRYRCNDKKLIVDFKLQETSDLNTHVYINESEKHFFIHNDQLIIQQAEREYTFDSRDRSIVQEPRGGQVVFTCDRI